jgi:hypothetical protein
MPTVVDPDATVETIVVQNAAGEIVALKPGEQRTAAPTILWSVQRGHEYFFRLYGTARFPQAADVDGDSRPSLVCGRG